MNADIGVAGSLLALHVCSKVQLFVTAMGTFCLNITWIVTDVRDAIRQASSATYHAEQSYMNRIPWLLACLLQDLCRKCIKHNASCGRAWERLGSILEREQAYKVEH